MTCPSELWDEPTNDERLGHLRFTLEQVLDHPPFLQLARMKQIALATGGQWDLPHDTPGVYTPKLCSITLGSVQAMTKDVADLPAAWIAAARDELATQNTGAAA